MRVSLCGSMVFIGVLCVCRWYLVRFTVRDQREVLLLCLRHDSAGKLLLLWPCLTLSACPWIWNQTRHGEHLALLHLFKIFTIVWCCCCCCFKEQLKTQQTKELICAWKMSHAHSIKDLHCLQYLSPGMQGNTAYIRYILKVHPLMTAHMSTIFLQVMDTSLTFSHSGYL